MTITKKKPAAFILGKRPEFIPATVSLTMPTGEINIIECKFKYRTRSEFGQFWDSLTETNPQVPASNASQEQPEQPAAQPERLTFSAALDKANRINVDHTLQFLLGWNLDHELNPENLGQLFDEVPAAASELFEAYRAAVVQGRLGN